jgi:hypothetical protein
VETGAVYSQEYNIFSVKQNMQMSLLLSMKHADKRFEVLTAVVMMSYIFWDITPCSPVQTTDVLEEHVASVLKAEE